MLLPALLPEQLRYIEKIQTEEELLKELIKTPSHYVLFFECACADETWCERFPDLMTEMISWITMLYFYDRFPSEQSKRAARAIRRHYPVLKNLIPPDVGLIVEGKKITINSLLYGTISDYFRDLIALHCREENKKFARLSLITLDTFHYFEEFALTGDAPDLWKEDLEQLFAILRQATLCEVGGLKVMCEDTIKRYIDRGNVIDFLVAATEEHWLHLQGCCLDFLNTLNMGVRLDQRDIGQLALEFQEWTETTIDLFTRLAPEVTHVICSGTLIEDPTFREVILHAKKLMSVDISRSRNYSEFLLEIPSYLRHLDLSQCPWLNHEYLKLIIETCPELTSLSLRSNTQLTFASWGELQHLHHLHSLDLSYNTQLQDDDLALIVKACPQISELFLNECTNISDRGFLELAKGLPRLSSLSVANTNLGDGPLVDLGTYCPDLISLDISRCQNLTLHGMLQFIAHAPRLRYLNIGESSLPPDAREAIKRAAPYVSLME